jgi:hypothetical protein
VNESRFHRASVFVGCSLVAAVGAVTAITGAVQHGYALCNVALFAVAAGALGAYLISRKQDAATDRAVLHRVRTPPRQPADDLVAELGLRPAAVRLSMQRLAGSGQISRNTDRG